MKQLDIFTLELTSQFESKETEEVTLTETEKPKEHQVEKFELKDVVEILAPGIGIDAEDRLYIDEFAGKKGTVVAMEEKSKPLAYWVDFGKSQGIFYASDMKFIR